MVLLYHHGDTGIILNLISMPMSHSYLQGCLASTGWPGVMAGFGPWVGQSARGFIMGVWQSNAYVGNIIGRELAGVFIEQGYNWGDTTILLSLILGEIVW